MWIRYISVTNKGPQHLEKGLIVGKRWRIIDKLGEGGCGAVYKVEDIQTFAKVSDWYVARRLVWKKRKERRIWKIFQAALKAESNFVEGGSVLKLEVQVLEDFLW